MNNAEKNKTLNGSNRHTGTIFGLTLFAIAMLSTSILTLRQITMSPLDSPALLPWESVGGCGASSAGGTGSSYQWLGQGLSGTMLDFEIRLSKMYQTANRWGMGVQSATTIPLTVNFHPYGFFFNNISLAMPIQWKEKDGNETGGIGDMTLTMQKKLGMTGQIGLSLGVTIPTGKYDVHDISHQYVDPVMQLGSGLFGISPSFDYSIDKDWGIMILGGSYSAGLFRMETQEYEWDKDLQRGVPSKRKFSWARVSGDEFITEDDYGMEYDTSKIGLGAQNDYGTMTPDNLSLFFYAGKKGEHMMTSAGLAASIPLSRYSREKTILYSSGIVELDAMRYPDPQNVDYAAVTSILENEVLDSAHRVGDPNYFVSGKDPNDSTGRTWKYGKSTYKLKKNWVVLTPGVGMEIQTKYFPLFMSFTLPIELNMDDGIGFNGFMFDVGMKLMAF